MDKKTRDGFLLIMCNTFPRYREIHASGRCWEEDFPDENGYYECTCCDCGKAFFGYKRRPICKKCANPPWIKRAVRWVLRS